MEVRSINKSPQFGMAVVKTKQAERLINQLPYDKAMEIKVMEMDSKKNPLDVFVSTIEKNGKERLKAEIGPKTFIENIFNSRVKVMRKATKYADMLHEEQQLQNSLTRGMVRPVL